MIFKFAPLNMILGLVVMLAPLAAHAQTLEAELGRVGKLRKTFGDEFVSGLTNLPPKKYFAARDQALAMADQVLAGSLARADAKKSLCDSFAKNGGNGCPALAEPAAEIAETSAPDESNVSAVQKNMSQAEEDDMAAVGEAAPTSPETSPETSPTSPETDTPERAPRSTKVAQASAQEQVQDVLPDGPSLDSDEPVLESGKQSAIDEPELPRLKDTDAVSVPKPRRAREPDLESDTGAAAGREVSSEVPLSIEPQS